MPRLTVLQLDTQFARPPGDVASPDTYCCPVDIVTIAKATVTAIVTARPADADLASFEAATEAATGDVVVTSCGFLGHWQAELQARTSSPFISSALIDLARLCDIYGDDRLGIVTFDAVTLGSAAYQKVLGDFHGPVIGLPPDALLRRVITDNHSSIDQTQVTAELISLIEPYVKRHNLRALLFECTNLPPYKAALRRYFDLPIYDILSVIQRVNRAIVKEEFL